uniref:ZZ-type domain-containing protein n=1 Tax=Chromera velia CCMP2878 TaxID=1169474 RepID=A0A0G4I323_9ALVE|eukprot:Cvel_10530.t1-p1 / transcript=Cvel_10530.t1 / gene=Cvel_10530 / organism=Chromera_velia_CCMP2878 / gene_product=hypothetical protein / transcript_product=hypothetical protein / location=Cvel_scaffold637:30709-35578(+) / protein_length=909 / sequence_SO=supercontig / SO=protein_coding / is_pseudo=false
MAARVKVVAGDEEKTLATAEVFLLCGVYEKNEWYRSRLKITPSPSDDRRVLFSYQQKQAVEVAVVGGPGIRVDWSSVPGGKKEWNEGQAHCLFSFEGGQEKGKEDVLIEKGSLRWTRKGSSFEALEAELDQLFPYRHEDSLGTPGPTLKILAEPSGQEEESLDLTEQNWNRALATAARRSDVSLLICLDREWERGGRGRERRSREEGERGRERRRKRTKTGGLSQEMVHKDRPQQKPIEVKVAPKVKLNIVIRRLCEFWCDKPSSSADTTNISPEYVRLIWKVDKQRRMLDNNSTPEKEGLVKMAEEGKKPELEAQIFPSTKPTAAAAAAVAAPSSPPRASCEAAAAAAASASGPLFASAEDAEPALSETALWSSNLPALPLPERVMDALASVLPSVLCGSVDEATAEQAISIFAKYAEEIKTHWEENDALVILWLHSVASCRDLFPPFFRILSELLERDRENDLPLSGLKDTILGICVEVEKEETKDVQQLGPCLLSRFLDLFLLENDAERVRLFAGFCRKLALTKQPEQVRPPHPPPSPYFFTEENETDTDSIFIDFPSHSTEGLPHLPPSIEEDGQEDAERASQRDETASPPLLHMVSLPVHAASHPEEDEDETNRDETPPADREGGEEEKQGIEERSLRETRFGDLRGGREEEDAESDSDESDSSQGVHTGYACVDCGQDPIQGRRWCCISCKGVFFCDGCKQKKTHNPNHAMRKMPPLRSLTPSPKLPASEAAPAKRSLVTSLPPSNNVTRRSLTPSLVSSHESGAGSDSHGEDLSVLRSLHSSRKDETIATCSVILREDLCVSSTEVSASAEGIQERTPPRETPQDPSALSTNLPELVQEEEETERGATVEENEEEEDEGEGDADVQFLTAAGWDRDVVWTALRKARDSGGGRNEAIEILMTM